MRERGLREREGGREGNALHDDDTHDHLTKLNLLTPLATQSAKELPTKFILLVAMERANAPPLSFGHPAAGALPVPMEQSQAKRPRPPAEAEQVSAIPIAPYGPWPRPHHLQQPAAMLPPPPWRAAGCRSQ